MKGKMTFEEIAQLLNLNPEDVEIDRMIFNSTILFCEHYLQKNFGRCVPQDLKECIIKLFLFKKSELIKQINGEDVKLELPESIKMVLDFHKVKML